jgi:Kef-type K+ transport system membrane component KefB
VTAGLTFGNLLVVTLIAVAAPLVARAIPAIKVPAVVLEIVAGIVVGPSVLGWVEVDQPVAVLALVGVAFLLFLAGLEIDLLILRGQLLRLTLLGFGLTLALGVGAGVAFGAAGWVDSPLFLAIALSATSLGLVVPVLKDAGLAEQPVGRYTIAADFGAVLLLSFLFSEAEGGTASRLITLAMFVAIIAATTLALASAGRSRRIDDVLAALQDTTAEIRVRIAVALLIAFVALAATVGLETILGAFLAGAVLSLIDRDTASHPNFRLKLDAVGYGFVIPVFFVTSGLRFDLDALTADASALTRVPLFLAALFAIRFLPALLYRRPLGHRGANVAGLLQATSLPFIVTAANIGAAIGVITPATAAALISAGLLSVLVFPAIALAHARPLAAAPSVEVYVVPGPDRDDHAAATPV